MNIVLDEAFEEKDGGEKVPMGMCVRITDNNPQHNPTDQITTLQCIRGNSLVMIEALERIDTK